MWKPLFIGTQSVDGSNSNTVYKLTKNTDPSLDCDYIYTGTSTTIEDGKEVKKSVFQPKYLKKVYETNIETNNGKRILKDKVTVYSGIEKREVDGEIVNVKVSYIDSGEGKFNISNRKDLKKLGENFPDKKHLIGATDTNMYVHLDDTTEVERCAYFSKYKNEIDTKLKEEEFVRAEARSEKAKALINKRRELRNIKIDLNDTNTEKNLDELTEQKGNLEREIAQIRQKPAPDKYVKTTEFIVKGDASKNEKDAIVKYALRSPDAVMLNDWHVGPYAALCRYLSPLKNHFNEVSDKTAKKMTNMPLFKLIHNAEYQGASYESTEPVLNTLFGKFAYPIVKNGAKTVPGMPASLSNTLAVDNHVNLMHMGAALADVDIAVSKTYAKELGSSDYPGAGFGGPLKPLFAARQREALKNRTLIGIINGNDKESFMLKGKKLNDLKKNYKGHCDNMIDLTPENFFKAKPEVRKSLLSVLSEHLKQVNAGNKNGLFLGNNGSTTYGNPDISKVTPNTPILLSAGRLVGQKGIDIETGAMRNLMKDFDKTFPGKEKPLIIILGS
ncbi:MAG: hypothetical protein GX638_03495, partial [Crenarchaeota archaeon]|nr:hypothetical protein [Thermoproteota archaeon]